jgi:hypothetical protein
MAKKTVAKDGRGHDVKVDTSTKKVGGKPKSSKKANKKK